MQVQVDPSEDTEWNAILREKGIIPQLPKPKEETPEPSPETKRREYAKKLSYNQINEELERLEDAGLGDEEFEEESKFLEEYRKQRLDDMRRAAARSKYGSVGEVTKSDWVAKINQAGNDVYVVVHIAQRGNERCNVVDELFRSLASRHPDVKFLRGESALCIPDLPDSRLPTIIVYYEGDMKTQFVGSKALGGHPPSLYDVEVLLAKAGVFKAPEEGCKPTSKPSRIRQRHNSSSEDSD